MSKLGTKVTWRKSLYKQLDKLPDFIVEKFQTWVDVVELMGIHKVRMNPGYHDEPLGGKRAGQRSIRLNRAYRAIYIERRDGSVEFLEVIEVNKHEY